MSTIELPIAGMHCNGCVDTITRAIRSAPGVRSAQVSLENGRATVEFDESSISREGLIDVVRAAGYEVPDTPKKPAYPNAALTVLSRAEVPTQPGDDVSREPVLDRSNGESTGGVQKA